MPPREALRFRSSSGSTMLDLSGLNPQQREAVLTREGPLLVLAGAGSGKTRVITYRLAHLIESGVSPVNILCVTFTNKAASEMKERAHKLVGKAARGVTISTFHALGARILRTFHEEAGLRPKFTISDGSEQLGTLRRILRALKIDDRRFDPKRILAFISEAKNAGVSPAQLRRQDGFITDDDGSLPDEDYRIAAIESYERYQSSLENQNVVDFDDLLLRTLHLVRECQDVREKLQARWRYLMVDEYQDTNGAQFELLRRLAGDRLNLCVVGDDDQSIYGWRGARVENILSFGRHFDGSKTVILDKNYRSTGHILYVANRVIQKNPRRYPKQMTPATGDGARVKIRAMADEEQEADLVASEVLGLVESGTKPIEIAILFRSNVQARPLEMAFRLHHVPYRLVGGMEFFDRKEIKDALSYLRVLQNPDDEQSLRRIVNYPPRGIGDTTVKAVDTWVRGSDVSFFEGLRKIYDVPNLTDRARESVASFVQVIDDHRRVLDRRKPSTVAKKLFEAVGLEDDLMDSSDNAESCSRRVENVRSIVRQIVRYEARKKGKSAESEGEPEDDEKPNDDGLSLFELEDDDAKDASLSGFLGELALNGWEDTGQKDVRQDRVTLTTVHAAKGLEWDRVYVVGVEENLIPHRRTVAGDGDLAEELRLAYVAFTRARKDLTISHALKRTRYGRVEPVQRSRFLEDLPEASVEYIGEGASNKEAPEDVQKFWLNKIRSQLGLQE
jgi:DNA helicase II / ATP-dependent DNA helicase PcrA